MSAYNISNRHHNKFQLPEQSPSLKAKQTGVLIGTVASSSGLAGLGLNWPSGERNACHGQVPPGSYPE